MPVRKVYWDACTFLGLLNQEKGKIGPCRNVWDECEQGHTIIFTSFLSFVEVFRAKCEGLIKPLLQEDDAKVLQLLRQGWITTAVLDERISLAARALMRNYPECKKPADAIHLATAMSLNVDEMHTFDQSDLLKLDGKVARLDKNPLTICLPRPTQPPPSDNLPLFPTAGTSPRRLPPASNT